VALVKSAAGPACGKQAAALQKRRPQTAAATKKTKDGELKFAATEKEKSRGINPCLRQARGHMKIHEEY